MKKFNVLFWDFNAKKLVPYDVIPHLVDCYKSKSKNKRPVTFEEFKKFVKDESVYQWWARCEYEIIVSEWPYRKEEPLKHAEKIDIWYQIEMNLDTVTKLLIESV